jgi:DNA-binding NarL/FixJ family response regulator
VFARIILAAHNDLMVLGASTVLGKCPYVDVTAAVQDVYTLVHRIEADKPNVILFSERLDPFSDPVALVERLKGATQQAHLMVVGATHDGLLIGDLFSVGIKAYLYESDELQHCLVPAVTTVMANRLYLSPTANAEYLTAIHTGERDWKLDPEARSVLRLLAGGCTIGSIAAQLQVNPRRVYWVREKLRHRFGATTNEHLISRAVAEGFGSFTD